jgi:hypothetical protein
VCYWQNSVVRGISTSVAGRFSFPTAMQHCPAPARLDALKLSHPDALAIEFLLDEHWCFALTTKISRRTSGRTKLAARQDMETRPISCFDSGFGD